MASLKERLSGQLHEMVAERNSLDEQIKQMRSVIANLGGNGAAPAPAPSRRRATKRRAVKRAPQMSGEERGKQILEVIAKKKQPVTSNEVASALGLSNTVTRKHIYSLVKSGGLKDAGVRPRDPNSRGGRESKLYALA